MRCKKCGWPNKPNETHCVKCHEPLSSDGGGDLSDVAYSNDGIQKTVYEEEAFASASKQGSINGLSETLPEQAVGSANCCPKCGYPLRPGAEKCPNCHFPVNGAVSQVDAKSNPQRKPTRMDSAEGAPVRRGTVNPYLCNIDAEPSFVLKPLKRTNERHELDELEFEGKKVSLNRANTEESNASITSHEQAVITHSEGSWFIEDKSEQKTTFVQAAHKIELHDGDLILLGNRLFEFHL